LAFTIFGFIQIIGIAVTTRPRQPATPPVQGAKNAADDDLNDLFRAEMAADGVVPLEVTARAALQKPKPKPIATQRQRDEANVPHELLNDTSGWDADIDTGDLISFLRAGLPSDILRKLKRGHWAVQATLDLHGHTLTAARDALAQFLAHARHGSARCVRIVHGKGYRSAGGIPLIRNKVRLSLSQREEVLAFCDAPAADGGAGAVVVLLRSS
jgi:DNA-nicking Smr family endonuclease